MKTHEIILVIVLAIVAITIATVFIQNRRSESKEGFDATAQDIARRYNSLGATQTVKSLNRLIPVTDPTGSRLNTTLQAAMGTPLPSPGGGGITNTVVAPVPTTAALPGRNTTAAQAAVCEKQSGFGTCAMLDDPAFNGICGVCVKGGSRSTDTTPGSWIGGLYIDSEDRAILPPQPTAGACPAGFFFLNRAACEKEVNRIQCTDAGAAGGWSGPSAPLVDAKCAQITPGGGFVYESKNRSFVVNLRLTVPGGTGRTILALYRVGSNGNRGKQIGAMDVDRPQEILLTSWEPVTEGETLELEAIQEFATHTKGTPEVYAVARGGYNLTRNTARELCRSLGARLATTAELENAHVAGADWCFSGHVSDASPRYPTQVPRSGCGEKAVNVWNQADGRAGATCFGIKPSTNDDYSATGSSVFPFTDQPSKRDSRFGRIQRGVRAIIAQWENSYDITGGNAYKTAIPFEGTVTSDTKRLGSFSNSGLIASPRAKNFPRLLPNQYWIWSGTGQTATFRCTVPATFLPPTYSEDASLVRGKPLVTRRSSLQTGKVSPCTSPPYSVPCLLSLFTAAGGDGAAGRLSPNVGGAEAVKELQAQGTEDAISAYVASLYSVATTGLNSTGSLAKRETVNAAAMKLFGFEIASPCEEIVAGPDGSVGLLPREAPLNPECMDYLYRNAGSEQSRGSEERGRKSPVKATYVSIGDRYSGIRKGEYGVTRQQLAATPFRTCTPDGTIAPMKYGIPNTAAIQKINSSTDGSIEGIQGFFNRIFQFANSDGSQDTLAACFGIRPAPPKKTVMLQSKNFPTRYITTNGLNQQVRLEEGMSVLSIYPGIVRGTVSFGPPGQPNQIFRHSNFVLYTNTVDGSDIQKKDMSFYMVKGLADTKGFSFKSYNYPDRYLRHTGFGFVLHPQAGDTTYINDATFYIKDPPPSNMITLRSKNFPTRSITANGLNQQVRLEEGKNLISVREGIVPGTIAMGPSYQPSKVFRHSGFVLYTNTVDTSMLQKQDSSFRVVSGLADPKGFSLQSYNFPDRYLRHTGFGFVLHPRANDSTYMNDATFYPA